MMKNTGKKLAVFLLSLALVLSLLPGMSLTAHAANDSETFTTNTGAGTYTGNHIKITGTTEWYDSNDHGDGIWADHPWTIQSLNGEIIKKIDFSIGYWGGKTM